MPKSQQKQNIPRQRPVSCRFCRARKLRCNREAPCSNCVSRGLYCELDHPVIQSDDNLKAAEIVQRLDRVERLLRERELNPLASLAEVSDTQSSPGAQVVACPQVLSPQIESLADDVARLERLCTGQTRLQSKIPDSRVLFRICSIQQITTAQSYVYQHEFPFTMGFDSLKYVWLPQYAEAQILLDKFLHDVHHVHHITHVPSLAPLFEEVYTGLTQNGKANPSHVILLLSIFAGATHSWARHDCERDLFSSPAMANEQAVMWIKAALDVLDTAQRSTGGVSIEGIQGMIILGFVMGNLEGFSHQCRLVLSTACWHAREIGLHRIDHPSNAALANTAQAEVGRRVWWYLCTTDWVMAARFTDVSEGVYSCHLRHMLTKKPLHINDEDIFDGMSRTEQPMSQPTTMSFALLRIRMAEIDRNLVDRTPLAMARLGGLSHEEVMDVDTELQMLLNDIPEFFSMPVAKLTETYQLAPVRAAQIHLQGYFLYFCIHAQRCKIHMPFVTQGLTNTAYFSSREICIRSARYIIQAQIDLQNSPLCAAARYKFTTILLGIFKSSIILLMDRYLNKSSPRDGDDSQRAVVDAFRILDEAKKESDTGARFVDSLMQILQKHRLSTLNMGPTLNTQSGEHGGAMLCGVSSGMHKLNVTNHPNGIPNLDSVAVPVETLQTNTSFSQFYELADSFEHGGDFGDFDWNNIFSDIGGCLI